MTTLTVALPRPATADTADARVRCGLGLVPDHEVQRVLVWGNGGGGVPAGHNPPNIIEPGDVFRVIPDFNSRVDPDEWLGGTLGPNGNGEVAPDGWPFPGLAKYSAVLRFNNAPTGWTSGPAQATHFNHCIVFQDHAPARFSFGVNDVKTSDNGGAWSFHVQIWRASAPTPANGPVNRCANNENGDRADRFIEVAGDGSRGSFPEGANPENFLRQGDVLRVDPDWNSKARMDYGFADHYPNGTSRPAPAGWPYPDQFEFSPIVRFNHNPTGWVGPIVQATALSGCLFWSDSRPVRLLFGVNDPDLSDNSQAWRFRVRVYNRCDRTPC
ncbi:hypothetical protein [Nonomuraea jiangxiensis]|nr:hypothetical protein [Nonomuraea jiangxiensis]